MFERCPLLNIPAAIGQLIFDKLRELTPVDMEELNRCIMEVEYEKA